MKLKKELGLLEVFCIASGAMISSGIFVLPGIAHAQAGPGVIVSYFLAGLLAMTGMLSQAELVSAMPKAGGTYFYVTRSMGPAIGTVDGLITWFSLSLKTAFALVGLAAFINLICREACSSHIMTLTAIGLCVFFITLNLIGIKEAGRVQVILVLVLLSALIFYIVTGIPFVKVQHFEPFAPHGVASIFSMAGFVFISYGGLLKIASIAEEVKNPDRTVPLGMFFSLLVVIVLYTLVVFVTSGVLGPKDLDHSLTPISDGAGAFMGAPGIILLSIAAVLAFVTTANAGIMAASRYPLALSRDGLLPESFGKINERFQTPHVAIIITGTFIIISLFLKIKILVEAASTVLILTFIFSNLSVIILRESRLQNYQPSFRGPLYPWVQITGILFFVFILFEMGKEALLISIMLVLCGLFAYWFYGRIRTTREYALLHLIQRVTAKELATHSLETELKDIIRERDDITKDRFDRIIEKSIVLDIEGPLKIDEFFHTASQHLAPSLQMLPAILFQMLQDREKESTTVLTPNLAIPHIIIDGEHAFDILLARCREGVWFSENAPSVHTIFVLAGTRDERNFHLRALAAIAQIVQDPLFEKRWLSARDVEALRDTVLLGKRRR